MVIILIISKAIVSQDILNNESLEDSKTLNRYYLNLFSETKNKESESLLPKFDVDKEKLLEKLKEAIPLSGAINPDKYITGPGDVLNIGIWGELEFNHIVNITPEGTLVIPTFGIIDIKGLTLQQLKEKVVSKLRKNFLKGDITVTLVSPRIFTVTVSGVVRNPGSYFASSVHRVDQVVYQSNLSVGFDTKESMDMANQKDLANTEEYIKYFNKDLEYNAPRKMSLRNIKVIRTSGDTLIADLVRYYATGDSKYNPVLTDGDRIVVPNQDLASNSISISGAVRLEGKYEYSPIDSVSSVFKIAQGPTKLADLENVDLYRIRNDSIGIKHVHLNLKKILSGENEDIKMLPNDRLVVREIYPRPAAENVVVKGEVRYPGLYPVVRNKTKLSEIIELAGGFTTNASLTEAKIIRSSNKIDPAENNPDYSRLRELRLSDLGFNNRRYYNMEAAIRRNFISVNFEKLFVEDDVERDIYLHNGDIILIPPKTNTIYVYGQVAEAGYVSYMADADYERYINLVGGYGEMARESEVMIIKAGSKLWIDPDDTEIEPGDAIFVPRELDTDLNFYFQWISNIVGVIGGVATIYLLFTK